MIASEERLSRLVRMAAAAQLLASSHTVPAFVPAGQRPGGGDSTLAVAVAATTRDTAWQQVRRLPLDFSTYHPQGFALVADRIFLSSVEVLEPTQPHLEMVGAYDRTPGAGNGHVLVMDRQGNLIRDIVVGEGNSYHPGGIDFDGESVWIPVAEYRPNGATIMYRLDVDTFELDEMFRVADHISGVVRDRVSGNLVGLTWGARMTYTWSPSGRQLSLTTNSDHMLDYQDCAYTAFRKQICSGVSVLAAPSGGLYELGGLALRGLHDDATVHEVPFPYFSSAHHAMTRNPVALEVDNGVLRMFAAPDDEDEVAGTQLYVFEVRIE